MTRGTTHAARLAILAAAVTAVILPAAAAHAAPGPQYEAQVTFTSVTADATGVTLSGTILSTGTDPVYNVQVALWRNADRITTADELRSVVADPASRTKSRVTAATARSDITSADDTFNPHATSTFIVYASWEDMGIDPGVYLVGVDVRASDTAYDPQATIGSGRTLVSAAASNSAAVVLFTSPPSLLHDNVFTDDHLADDLKVRLSALMSLAARPGVSWAVDPALLYEVETMAQGYEVLDPAAPPDTQGTTPGTAESEAAAWLDQFGRLPVARGYRLPWGNPDLGLGTTNNTPAIVTASLTAAEGRPDSAAASLPLLVRPANGLADKAFLEYVSPLAPTVILAQADANYVAGGARWLNTAPMPFPPGVSTRDVAAGSAGAPAADATVQSLQLAIATDALIPDIVRTIQTQAEADQEIRLMSVQGSSLPLASLEATVPWTPGTPGSGPAAGTLTLAGLTTTNNARGALTTYAGLTQLTTPANRPTAIAEAALASQSWDGDAAAGAYAAAAQQWIASLLANITLTASPEVSLTWSGAAFPVTVSNKLSTAIHVRISSTTSAPGGSPANVTIPTTDLVTIQPGDKQSVVLSPIVFREGDVAALLQLTTDEGTPVGPSVPTTLHAQSSAWMGWLVVGGAAALLVVGTFLRVRTARKESADNPGPPLEQGDGSGVPRTPAQTEADHE